MTSYIRGDTAATEGKEVPDVSLHDERTAGDRRWPLDMCLHDPVFPGQLDTESLMAANRRPTKA